MLINDLINGGDLLNEISFKKTLGTAALGLGLIHGGQSLHNYEHPAAPNLTHQITPDVSSDKTLNISDIPKVVQAISKEAPQAEQPQLTTTELKTDFILKVRPLIDRQNAQIISDRKFLLSIQHSPHLNNQQQSKYEIICTQYNSSDIKELLVRVDVIPEALTLAQAATESGWGKSNFAQDGHSLFGQKVSRDSNDFASYDSFQQSITAYMHNLNTNPAYKKFRMARHYMRTHGNELNAVLLARTLTAYDSTGKAYTKKIQLMINHVIPQAERLAMK